MSDSPATRASLLVRIRNPHDSAAWGEFVELYAPLIYRFGCKQRLQDADAADLTQDVLGAVAAAAGRFEYDPSRGSFRGWLFTIARNRLTDLQEKQRRREQGSGDTEVQQLLDQQPASEEELSALWEREYQQQLLAQAAERIRGHFHETTWQAFQQTTVEGRSIQETARTLGLSVAAVYLARSRVMKRLKEEVRRLQEE